MPQITLNPSSIEALVQMIGPGAGASRDQTEMAVTFPFQVVPHKASDVNLSSDPLKRPTHVSAKARCYVILLSYGLSVSFGIVVQSPFWPTKQIPDCLGR